MHFFLIFNLVLYVHCKGYDSGDPSLKHTLTAQLQRSIKFNNYCILYIYKLHKLKLCVQLHNHVAVLILINILI